jgi:glycosyltransferase involved in cell wall biosynthesis
VREAEAPTALSPTRLLRAVYVHGRPAPHPNRLRLLPAIGASLVPVDFSIPWAHAADPSAMRKAASLVWCSLTFPDRRGWDLIIGDGPQHLPVVMKRLGLLHRRQKILPYLAGEFAYFLATGYYGRTKTAMLRRWFLNWDGYLCLGNVTANLVRQVLPEARHRDLFVFPNFIRSERVQELGPLDAPLEGTRVLFIGNGPGGFRVFYKGLDLLLRSYSLARARVPGLECSVAGDWSIDTARRLEQDAGLSSGQVRWLGPIEALGPTLTSHSLYVHCGRGDAWPNTVMEAMAAGLPALVTDMTGGAEIIRAIEPRLVVPLDAEAVARAIEWYAALPTADRRGLGRQLRAAVLDGFTEARARLRFREMIRTALDHFGLSDVALPPLPGGEAEEGASALRSRSRMPS